MARNSPSRQRSANSKNDEEHRLRDRDLEAWMDRALGVRHPDPEPVVRDL